MSLPDMSLAELDRYLRFPSPHVQMIGLETALETIEDQLRYLKSQHEVRLRARLANTDMTEEDRADEAYDVKTTVDKIFPKVFRNGFVLTLWAAFESSVKNIAGYVQKELRQPFSLTDLRRGDFFKQMEDYFHSLLNVEIFPDKDMKDKLVELNGLRNALIHHDGAVEALPKRLRSVCRSDCDESGLILIEGGYKPYIIPGSEYLRSAHSTVKAYLESFSDQTYIAVHPVRMED